MRDDQFGKQCGFTKPGKNSGQTEPRRTNMGSKYWCSGHLGQRLPVICSFPYSRLLSTTETFREKSSSFIETVICRSRAEWRSTLSQTGDRNKRAQDQPCCSNRIQALRPPVNTPFSPNKNASFLTFTPVLPTQLLERKTQTQT